MSRISFPRNKFEEITGLGEPGITETIITCQTGIRYSGIGYNGNRYNKVSMKQESGITESGRTESGITENRNLL